MLEIHLTNKKMFSKEEIRQIKKLFRDELGLEVSEEEACGHAAQLIELLKIAYRDIPDTSSSP